MHEKLETSETDPVFVTIDVPVIVDAALLQLCPSLFSYVCSRLCTSKELGTMTLSVQHDDGRCNLPTCSKIVSLSSVASRSTDNVLVGFRCLLRCCPPLQRRLFEVACGREFEEGEASCLL